jgi:CheY-like chemotaxis protein
MPPEPLPLRILVVDHDPDTRASYRILLELWGHEVGTAGDGASALATAIASRPRVVLLSTRLPDMDGFELARRLRQRPELSGMTLLALIGSPLRHDPAAARAAGIDHVLLKPVDPQELHSLLDRLAPEH